MTAPLLRLLASLAAPVRLHRPGLLFGVIYAALVTLAVCYPAWPGFMSYDSLFAYEQGVYGVQTMLWPPLHAYMFALSDKAGLGPGGVFALQVFLLFAGAAASIFSLVSRRWLAALLCAAFALSFIYVPPQLGVLLAQWRDVTTASFALTALALWLQAARLRSRALLIAAILVLGLAIALRYNAFALIFAMVGLMVWRPWLDDRARLADRALVVVAVVVAFGAAWASTQWRLPDLMQMPAPQNFGGTQELDVIGVSACAGRNYKPKGASSGQVLTVDQIRRTYDPRHLHRTLAPRNGIPALVETDANGQMPAIWLDLVKTQTGCYLAHRALVMVEQMGMAKTAPFYPVHSGLDANAFGLKFARPELAEGLRRYVEESAGALPRRPFLLYLGAVAAVGLALAARRSGSLLLLALLAGVAAYPALLFVAAPAADARYIFPSNTLATLAMLLAVGLLFDGRPGRLKEP